MASKIKLEEEDEEVEDSVDKHQDASAAHGDRLFQLTSDQADKLSFPTGCPVLYNFQQCTSNVTGAREGIVRSVSLITDKKRFVFQIERRRVDSDGGGEQILDETTEDDIAYAINAPVLVTSRDNVDVVPGKVIFVKPISSKGEMRMNYIVQYTLDDQLRMEEAVTADRIAYHKHVAKGNEADEDERSSSEERPRIIDEANDPPPPNVVPMSSPTHDSEGGKAGVKREHVADSARLPPSLQQPKLQSDSAPKTTPAQLDVMTSPLSCDVSDSTDRPIQHKKINFQPPDPLRKRSNSNANQSFERPSKLMKTESSHIDEAGEGGLTTKLTVPLWALDSGKKLFRE